MQPFLSNRQLDPFQLLFHSPPSLQFQLFLSVETDLCRLQVRSFPEEERRKNVEKAWKKVNLLSSESTKARSRASVPSSWLHLHSDSLFFAMLDFFIIIQQLWNQFFLLDFLCCNFFSDNTVNFLKFSIVSFKTVPKNGKPPLISCTFPHFSTFFHSVGHQWWIESRSMPWFREQKWTKEFPGRRAGKIVFPFVGGLWEEASIQQVDTMPLK